MARELRASPSGEPFTDIENGDPTKFLNEQGDFATPGGGGGAVASVEGSDGITPSTPQVGAVVLSGAALLPLDGSRAMTGALDGGGNNVGNVGTLSSNAVSSGTGSFGVSLGVGGPVTGADFNGVPLTDGGAGTSFLADDGTYKPVGGGGVSDLQGAWNGGPNIAGNANTTWDFGTGNFSLAANSLLASFAGAAALDAASVDIRSNSSFFNLIALNPISAMNITGGARVTVSTTASGKIFEANAATQASLQAGGLLADDGTGTGDLVYVNPNSVGPSAGAGAETYNVIESTEAQAMTNNILGRLYCMAVVPLVSATIDDLTFVIAQNNAGGTGAVGIYSGLGVRLAYSPLAAFALGQQTVSLSVGGPVSLLANTLYYFAIEANINSCSPLSIQGASVYNPPIGPSIRPLAFFVPNSRSVDPTGFPPDVSGFFGQVGGEARKYFLLGTPT